MEIGPKARGEIGPGLAPYLFIIDQVFVEFDFECRITHIRDGLHSKSSLHYVGDAIDVVWLPYTDLDLVLSEDIRLELYRRLNGFPQVAGIEGDYDIVFEKTHFHIEYQPKTVDTKYREQVDQYLYGE